MTLYLSGAGAYGLFLLINKFCDRECSKTDPRSWLILTIASALWPLVLPISLVELRLKAKAKNSPEFFDSEPTGENSLQVETMPVQ